MGRWRVAGGCALPRVTETRGLQKTRGKGGLIPDLIAEPVEGPFAAILVLRRGGVDWDHAHAMHCWRRLRRGAEGGGTGGGGGGRGGGRG